MLCQCDTEKKFSRRYRKYQISNFFHEDAPMCIYEFTPRCTIGNSKVKLKIIEFDFEFIVFHINEIEFVFMVSEIN